MVLHEVPGAGRQAQPRGVPALLAALRAALRADFLLLNGLLTNMAVGLPRGSEAQMVASRRGVAQLDAEALGSLLKPLTLGEVQNCDMLRFVQCAEGGELHVTMEDIPRIHEALNLMKDHEYETAGKLLAAVARNVGYATEAGGKDGGVLHEHAAACPRRWASCVRCWRTRRCTARATFCWRSCTAWWATWSCEGSCGR